MLLLLQHDQPEIHHEPFRLPADTVFSFIDHLSLKTWWAHRFGSGLPLCVPVFSGGIHCTFNGVDRGVPGGRIFESILG